MSCWIGSSGGPPSRRRSTRSSQRGAREARRLARGLDHHKAEAVQRRAAHAGHRLQEAAEREIDLAGVQRGDELRAVAVVQDHVEAGVALRVLADHRGQQLARDQRGGADGEAPVRGRGRATDVGGRGLQLEQAAVGDRQELGAELGQRDAARGAFEQAKPELLLARGSARSFRTG